MRTLGIAVLLALAAASPAAASWSAPSRVSPQGMPGATPFVGFAADGAAQVGWACAGAFRGHCRPGSRAGFAREPFAAPLTAAVPHVAEAGALDPRGGEWLMGAVDKHDGDRMEAVHLDRSGRVVERSSISPRGVSARHPSLAVNARGDVLAAWEQGSLVEAAWRRHGRPWRRYAVSAGRTAQAPAVALNDSAAGIVAFRSGAHVRVADLGPRGWGSARAVGPAGATRFVPVAAALAPSGAAAVTWAQGFVPGEGGVAGPTTVLAARRAAHQAFSGRRTTVLDGQASPAGFPAVAVADDGATLVGWIGGSGPAVAYAPAASGFTPRADLAGQSALRIAVALGGGRAYVAWTDGPAVQATDGPAGGDFAAPQDVGTADRLRLALAANDRGAVLASGGGDLAIEAARDVNPAAR